MIRTHTFRQLGRSLQVGLLAVLFNAAILLAATPAEAKTPVKLVAFGDSLTAGYLLKPDESFPAQLSGPSPPRATRST